LNDDAHGNFLLISVNSLLSPYARTAPDEALAKACGADDCEENASLYEAPFLAYAPTKV